MQSAAASQDQMQNVMKDLLQEVHSSLKLVLRHCLQQVAAEMFNKNLISQSVKDDPTYDKFITLIQSSIFTKTCLIKYLRVCKIKPHSI